MQLKEKCFMKRVDQNLVSVRLVTTAGPVYFYGISYDAPSKEKIAEHATVIARRIKAKVKSFTFTCSKVTPKTNLIVVKDFKTGKQITF